MKRQLDKIFLVAGFLVASPLMATSNSHPSYQNFVNAKNLCMGMAKKVKEMIAQTQMPEGPRYFAPVENEHPNGDVLENDTAALFALQGMGRGTFALGQSLDQALAHYGSPDFYVYHNAVCEKARFLGFANIGAKTAAALPSVGVIAPWEFDQFEVEISQVKTETNCF
jgi:hypothetical protein